MSSLNGYHGPQRELTNAEWDGLRAVAEGELTPGAMAGTLRRVVSNFEHLSTDQLRQRCADLCEMREQWQI